MVKAHLIAVGSELFLPGHEDSNTLFLRHRLFELGIPVVGVSVVGDDETAPGAGAGGRPFAAPT